MEFYLKEQNNYNPEMVKKTQLRKYSVEKIMELVNGETSGENLKIYNEAIDDKNKLMLEKHVNLLSELEDLRSRIEKVFREMNVGVKDRIQMKSKNVLDKYSRPTKDDIREVTNLFTYLQHQHHLMQRNSSDLSAQNKKLASRIGELRPKLSVRVDSSDLDQQYLQLNEQCAREEEVRNALAKERESNLKFYNSIESSIEQYRVEYELVEERIREKERELIQLTSYFETRKNEDEQFLSDLRQRTSSLENELLKAQEILNTNSSRCESLMIRQIEAMKHTQN